MTQKSMACIDLAQQQLHLGDSIDHAIRRVLAHGNYIMGPEVIKLEASLSEFCGAKHTLTCSNGTDALGLILMALAVGPGDAVFCPSFTFAATAEVVAWFGATPVFVDIHPDTFNIDPASFEAGIAAAKLLGLAPVGVIPVDLFGLPADYDQILEIAAAHRMWVICDAAQSFGAAYRDRKVGTIGDLTTTRRLPCCAACASTGKAPTNTIMCGSA